jgi:hypothetical protein
LSRFSFIHCLFVSIWSFSRQWISRKSRTLSSIATCQTTRSTFLVCYISFFLLFFLFFSLMDLLFCLRY